jgi:hypothetical protein
MARKYAFLVFLFVTICFSQQPSAARLWTYANCTGLLSKNLAFVIMPGMRYEFLRRDDIADKAKNVYFYELLAGPVFIMKHKAWTLKLPFWYYYMGFPIAAQDDYFYAHNLEFLPIIEFRKNDLTFISRTIFHNTVYATVYEEDDDRKGYGLVIREMFRVDYHLNDNIVLVLADEPFFGVIEDRDALVHPLGYWANGFRMNRVYAGCNVQLNKHLSFSPQYVFETSYDTDGQLDAVNHYLFLTLTYVLKLFN